MTTPASFHKRYLRTALTTAVAGSVAFMFFFLYNDAWLTAGEAISDLNDLAGDLQAEGQSQRAEDVYRSILGSLDQRIGDAGIGIPTRVYYGLMLARQHRSAECEAQFQRALTEATEDFTWEYNEPELAWIQAAYSECLMAGNKPDEARRMLETANRTLQESSDRVFMVSAASRTRR